MTLVRLISTVWPTALAERTGPTPTITQPDLVEVRDVKPKAPRPYKVVVRDWTTEAVQLS